MTNPYLEFGGLTDAGLNTILEDSNLSGAMGTSFPNEVGDSYQPKKAVRKRAGSNQVGDTNINPIAEEEKRNEED